MKRTEEQGFIGPGPVLYLPPCLLREIPEIIRRAMLPGFEVRDIRVTIDEKGTRLQLDVFQPASAPKVPPAVAPTKK